MTQIAPQGYGDRLTRINTGWLLVGLLGLLLFAGFLLLKDSGVRELYVGAWGMAGAIFYVGLVLVIKRGGFR